MIFILSREEGELVRRLRALEPVTASAELTLEVARLKREIAALEISRSQKVEEFEKRERELRHMVGLEKQRQEAERHQQKVEVVQAEQAAMLKVREENLVAERKRFEEQLVFNTERFAQMEKYLKDMLTDILKRLPNISMKITQASKE